MADTAERVPNAEHTQSKDQLEPSNEVYRRVGEKIRLAAHRGVQRNLTPQDIVREIVTEYGVHLNVGELRLLLASRRPTPDK
ncbi:MAG: hypothetical protein ACR2GA_06490 [Chloroflexota bacterium]